MRAEFSEFTYGFSLVSELARALRCAAVPIFPSLKKEGQEGGGYDVNLSIGAVPMFLQFKLSEHLKTKNAKEAKNPIGLISAPYRRFHITASVTSNQHAMLLGLGAEHQHVFYCAPDFYQVDDLDHLWSNGLVSEATVFVHPCEIGEILDDKKHAVCFNGTTLSSDVCYLFSEPKPLKARSLALLRGAVAESLREARVPLRELLPKWAHQLDNARTEGRRLHREYVNTIEKIREARRLAAMEEEGLDEQVEAAFELRPGRVIGEQFEPFAMRSRLAEEIEVPSDPEMRQLFDLGRRAATEFRSQLFVLQPNSV